MPAKNTDSFPYFFSQAGTNQNSGKYATGLVQVLHGTVYSLHLQALAFWVGSDIKVYLCSRRFHGRGIRVTSFEKNRIGTRGGDCVNVSRNDETRVQLGAWDARYILGAITRNARSRSPAAIFIIAARNRFLNHRLENYGESSRRTQKKSRVQWPLEVLFTFLRALQRGRSSLRPQVECKICASAMELSNRRPQNARIACAQHLLPSSSLQPSAHLRSPVRHASRDRRLNRHKQKQGCSWVAWHDVKLVRWENIFLFESNQTVLRGKNFNVCQYFQRLRFVFTAH